MLSSLLRLEIYFHERLSFFNDRDDGSVRTLTSWWKMAASNGDVKRVAFVPSMNFNTIPYFTQSDVAR